MKTRSTIAMIIATLTLAACGSETSNQVNDATPAVQETESAVETSPRDAPGGDEATTIVQETESTPEPSFEAEEPTPTVGGSEVVSFEFENPDGYRFAVELVEFDYGVELDIANAKPGEANVRVGVSLSARFTNLLPNKNFDGGYDKSNFDAGESITLLPLYPLTGAVCSTQDSNTEASWVELQEAGYCFTGIPGVSLVIIGIPSLAGGESITHQQGVMPLAQPGASPGLGYVVPEESGTAFADELARPHGFIVTHATASGSGSACLGGDFDIAYSSVPLNC